MTHIKCSLMKMKAELKLAAIEIRTLKNKRKELKGYVPGLGNARWNFRAKHIAYCLLRGRTLEQIEPKLRDPNANEHKGVRERAAKIVADVLNPQPPVTPIAKPVEVKEETLWNKVISSLS